METKNFDDLKLNPKNPRTISDHDFQALQDSIREFGDLSGIVFNVTTGQLVGGHQRVKAFKRLSGQKQVVITQRYDAPDNKGTVAFGHVTWDNQFFPYREVEWDENREYAANVAANRISGEFDLDLLAEINYKLAQEDQELLALTGQTPEEIKQLLNAVGVGEPEEASQEPSMVLRVECSSDDEMSQLYQELTDRGLKVKI